MMGQSVLLDLARGDEVYVYSFTGTWTTDFPHIHFTQFIGIFQFVSFILLFDLPILLFTQEYCYVQSTQLTKKENLDSLISYQFISML